MNKVFSRLIVVFMVVTALFGVLVGAACDNEVVNSYEYFADIFDYREDHGSGSFVCRTQSVETDFATYNFDEEIPLKKRNRFVTFSDQLLAHLGHDKQQKELVFFVSDDIKSPRADTDEQVVYFSSSNAKTVELISFVLQALNTNTLNYGLAYGVSAKIHAELGWGKVDTVSDFWIKSFLKKDKNRFVLDLTYPVFHKKFASKQQIKYAKSISIKLANYIETTYGKQAFDELFKADQAFDMTFDNLFYGYANEWLTSLKLPNIPIGTEVLKCVAYTADFPYILLTNSCEYYVDKDWKDSGLADHYTMKDFVFDYPSVKEVLLKAEAPYASVREFFDYEQSGRALVFLQYMETAGGRTFDNYFAISSLFALTHEYTHLISFNKHGRTPSWMLEAIAYYCDAIFNDLSSNEFYAAHTQTEEYLKFISEYLDETSTYVIRNYLGKNSDQNYFIRFVEGYCYVAFFQKDINLHEVYKDYRVYSAFTISFSHFLTKTYGKEKYIDLYKQGGFVEHAYEKTETQILDEYLAYINNIYNAPN